MKLSQVSQICLINMMGSMIMIIVIEISVLPENLDLPYIHGFPSTLIIKNVIHIKKCNDIPIKWNIIKWNKIKWYIINAIDYHIWGKRSFKNIHSWNDCGTYSTVPTQNLQKTSPANTIKYFLKIRPESRPIFTNMIVELF